MGCARLVTDGHDTAPQDVPTAEVAPPDAADAGDHPEVPTPIVPSDAAPPADVQRSCVPRMPLPCASERTRVFCDQNGVPTAEDCPDRAAATGRCHQGTCTIACVPGAYDCDDDPRNGCESARPCPSVMLSGFGGSTGYGPDSQCVHASDNGTYAGPGAQDGDPAVPVDLSQAFPEGIGLFGRPMRAAFVNVNGVVSFAGPVARGTPGALPIAGQPMVAPWWADVDTRGGGQPLRNNVCFVLQPRRLVVTWDRVGRHDRRDDRVNSFQLVLRTGDDCAPELPTIEFRYARCEWSAGDASGEVHALVGFDAGNRTNYLSLPASRTAAILDVCRLTNVPGGPPGLFRFSIRATGCWGNI